MREEVKPNKIISLGFKTRNAMQSSSTAKDTTQTKNELEK